MTLKEIAAAVKEANTQKEGEDMGDFSQRRWEDLPRVYYSDLPAKLKQEADTTSIDGAKKIIIESYPVGTIDALIDAPEHFSDLSKKAFIAARYLIEDAESDPPKVSLIAIDLLEAWEKVTGQELPKVVKLPNIASKRVDKLDFPVDKVNSKMWDILGEDTKGQIRYIAAESKKDKQLGKQINILYALDFERIDKAVSITRRLTPYDELVYIAVSALFNADPEKPFITIQQIYNAMGFDGKVGDSDRKKINDAITKMSGARILIDNMQEINAKYKYPSVKYDGSLLPMERVQIVVKGQVVDAAVHVFREPPLMSFARGRKQITTIERKLLANSPLNMTDANIRLQTYLIERISRMKNERESTSCKILFKTLYDETGIKTSKQQQRAPEKIQKLLEHYVKCEYIKSYAPKNIADLKTADGITIKY